MSAIAKSVLADLDQELDNTRKVLSRIPEAHLGYRPHEKSWPLQHLATHIADFGEWGVITLATDVLNFADPMPPKTASPTTGEEFVARFNEKMAKFQEMLSATTDAHLMETWTMKNGDDVIMAMPRIAVLRSMIVNHMIHHRAQLTMYFRLLDVPVPGLYGPSADEQ